VGAYTAPPAPRWKRDAYIVFRGDWYPWIQLRIVWGEAPGD